MKQIKFRGRHINTGEWLFGSHYDDCGEEYILPNIVGSAIDYEDYQVDPNTVGQYTNLHDKKDQEIYKGDILLVEFSDKSGGKYLVGWNEKTASWGIMDRYEYQSLKEGYDFAEFKNHTLLAFFKEAIICEVVGNIYDNPELMNVPVNK